MSVHFEERSGVVPCKTPWGSWYQTMEEVFIEVNVPHGTSAKEVKCQLGSRDIELRVKGEEIFKVGSFFLNIKFSSRKVNKDVGYNLLCFSSVLVFCLLSNVSYTCDKNIIGKWKWWHGRHLNTSNKVITYRQ